VYMAAELHCINVVLAQDLQVESRLQHDSSADIDSIATVHVLSSDELWQYCCNRAASFPQRYAVYRHFAQKG
jgi:tRNA splicing endonuclease